MLIASYWDVILGFHLNQALLCFWQAYLDLLWIRKLMSSLSDFSKRGYISWIIDGSRYEKYCRNCIKSQEALKQKNKKNIQNHLLLFKVNFHCLSIFIKYQGYIAIFLQVFYKERGTFYWNSWNIKWVKWTSSQWAEWELTSRQKVSADITFLLYQYNYNWCGSYEYFRRRFSIKNCKWKKKIKIKESNEGCVEGTRKMPPKYSNH